MTTFQASPLTSACHLRRAGTHHVCLGISPFNSYYSTQRISDLVGWALENFDDAHYFVPDEAPAHTFRALGYTESRAGQKARKQAKCVVNRIAAGLRDHGIEDPGDRIVTAEVLRGSARYTELVEEARARFTEDDDFREAILATSTWVLQGYLPEDVTPTLEQRETAVQYFLDELPMFTDTPGILGVGPSAFVYHQHVDVLRRLFEGELPWTPSSGQSFLVVAPAEEGAPAGSAEQDEDERLTA